MVYKAVIDLTQKAQDAKRKQQAQERFQEPDPALPPVDVADLPEAVADGVRGAGWAGLMPVQQRAIPYMLDGQDLIVQARTGTGKTGAFLLPLLDLLDPHEKAMQALVLGPTRELAKQILAEFDRMNAEQPEAERLHAVAVYGGVGYGPQIDAFKQGAQLVVGTPGRVLDHLEKGTLRLDSLRILILDEADEMLSMGFYPAMKKLQRYLPRERQSYMFSATMPFKVQRVGEEFLDKPGFLTLSSGRVHVDAMDHRSYKVNAMDKDRALVSLIEMENPDAAIIFANTRREVEYLAAFLRNFGHDAAEISSDLTQKAREKVMARLRSGELRFLVATDVAARGIDISDLSHVFMYDIPQDREYYIHRAGRTARAGKTGVAISIVTQETERVLDDIAKKYDIDLDKRDLPTDAEIAERVGQRLVVLLEERLRERTRMERERMQRFVPLAQRLIADEEPELLAMLLDEVYHESLHASASVSEAQERQEPRPKGRDSRGRSRGRR
ncbi:MAG: DEAD/DEAH box helicase [Bacteroidota bacterium]